MCGISDRVGRYPQEQYHGSYALRLKGAASPEQARRYAELACAAMQYVQVFYLARGFTLKTMRVQLENKFIGWAECFESIEVSEL